MLVVLGAALLAATAKMDGYVGTIVFGPEAMYFLDCASGEKYWLGDGSFDAKGWKEVSGILDAQPLCDLHTMPCSPQKVIIFGRGPRTGPGQFGHLGDYPYEIHFAEMSIGTQADLEKCERDT